MNKTRKLVKTGATEFHILIFSLRHFVLEHYGESWAIPHSVGSSFFFLFKEISGFIDLSEPMTSRQA